MNPTEYQHTNPEDSRTLLCRNTYDQFGRLYLKTYYSRYNAKNPAFGGRKTWLYADKFIYNESTPAQQGGTYNQRYSNNNNGGGEPVQITRIYKPDLGKPIIEEQEFESYVILFADVNLKSSRGQRWPGFMPSAGIGFVYDQSNERLKENMIRNTHTLPGSNSNWNGSRVHYVSMTTPIAQINGSISVSMYSGPFLYMRTFAVIENGVQFSAQTEIEW